jgi:branched-chain amino acid transport system permease protein
VIGGEGTLIGPAFGSILITLLPTLFQPLAIYKTFFSGALLILCFLYLPRGIYGVIAAGLSRLSPQLRQSPSADRLAQGSAQ